MCMCCVCVYTCVHVCKHVHVRVCGKRCPLVALPTDKWFREQTLFSTFTHFTSLASFFTHWKHNKTPGFLFSGSIERPVAWNGSTTDEQIVKTTKKFTITSFTSKICLILNCQYKTIDKFTESNKKHFPSRYIMPFMTLAILIIQSKWNDLPTLLWYAIHKFSVFIGSWKVAIRLTLELMYWG